VDAYYQFITQLMTNLNGSDLQGFIRRRDKELKKIDKFYKQMIKIHKYITSCQKEIAYLNKHINSFSEII